MTRLSVIIEWANTELNSVSRALEVLRELVHQWLSLKEIASSSETSLSPSRRAFLRSIQSPPELIIASGQPVPTATAETCRQILSASFDWRIVVHEGAEYYPLKNLGADRSSGDLLLFLDSDVLPDPAWLVELLGVFSDPAIAVCSGQPYVKPQGLFGKAFACLWTYDFRDPSGKLWVPNKNYSNNVVFRREAFFPHGFPDIGRRTRGAGSALVQVLSERGISFWENRIIHHHPAGPTWPCGPSPMAEINT
jgi:glycosyltransferase involved in cell wall biosynthesis